MEWPQGLQPVEMLYGGERLGGARMTLADIEKAAEKYDQLSRQPGLNPEAIRRIYGGYLEAVDPEDEEKREKARAALERVIEDGGKEDDRIHCGKNDRAAGQRKKIF